MTLESADRQNIYSIMDLLGGYDSDAGSESDHENGAGIQAAGATSSSIYTLFYISTLYLTPWVDRARSHTL